LHLTPQSGGGSIFSGDFWTTAFTGFIVYISVTWWANVNSDGGGKIIQRQNACKNEQHALLATLWYSLTNLAFRSWPWILVALCSLILLPEIKDPEMAYPQLMMQLLPFGLKGLLSASLLAAFMSTISTQLNWGASYLAHDFYRHFLVRDKSERHYLWIGKLSTIVILLCAGLAAWMTTSVTEAFKFIIAFGAGTGPVYVLRWFWWRINAWSEIAAMAASSVITVYLYSHPGIFFGAKLLIITFGSALVWVTITLLTKPAPLKDLAEFQRRTRPPGLWNPVRQWAREHGLPAPRRETLSRAIRGWLWGMAFVVGLTMAIGYALFLSWTACAIWCAVTMIGLWGLKKDNYLATA
jgi:Na+/proline symporter